MPKHKQQSEFSQVHSSSSEAGQQERKAAWTCAIPVTKAIFARVAVVRASICKAAHLRIHRGKDALN